MADIAKLLIAENPVAILGGHVSYVVAQEPADGRSVATA